MASSRMCKKRGYIRYMCPMPPWRGGEGRLACKSPLCHRVDDARDDARPATFVSAQTRAGPVQFSNDLWVVALAIH